MPSAAPPGSHAGRIPPAGRRIGWRRTALRRWGADTARNPGRPALRWARWPGGSRDGLAAGRPASARPAPARIRIRRPTGRADARRRRPPRPAAGHAAAKWCCPPSA
ncbi:hypothetical protein G6F23_015114 [Rhizopus arrhizus]|nr:hypothetical protein G6F23_015114 [Rhizopus arrhizus]